MTTPSEPSRPSQSLPHQSPSAPPASAPLPAAAPQPPRFATPLPPGAPAAADGYAPGVIPAGRPDGRVAPGAVPPAFAGANAGATTFPAEGFAPTGVPDPARSGRGSRTGLALGIIALVAALAALALLCVPGWAWLVAVVPAVIAIGAGAFAFVQHGTARLLGILGFSGGLLAAALICATAIVVVL